MKGIEAPVQDNNEVEDDRGHGPEKSTESLAELQKAYYKKRIEWLEAIHERDHLGGLAAVHMDKIVATADSRISEVFRAQKEKIKAGDGKINRLSQEMDELADAVLFADQDASWSYESALKRVQEIDKLIAQNEPELSTHITRPL